VRRLAWLTETRTRFFCAVFLACGLATPAYAQAARWTITTTPSPSVSLLTPSSLSGVSCATATMCMAVGSTQDAGGRQLIEAWNGSSWSTAAAPTAAGVTLTNLSCPTASMCMAVGYKGSGQTAAPVAELWNGSAWSMLSGAQAPGVSGALSDVSCSSATECMAVGEITSQSAVVSALWNGTSWTAEPIPSPPPGGPHGTSPQPATGVSAVSCAPDGSCGAVGQYTTYGEQAGEDFMANWNGTAWSIQAGPAPGKVFSQAVNGISCTAAAACEAVGAGALGYSGQMWSGQTLPVPTSSALQGAALSSDSCTAADTCVGVGTSIANDGDPAGIFADTYDGSAWTLKPIATPAGGEQPQLDSVSCSSATACMAVGSYDNVAGISIPLTLSYDGTGWSQQATPAMTTTGTTSSLSAVSCSAPHACMAVGTDAGGVLAMRSGAGGWSLQSPPNPGGATAASTTMPAPAAVACPAAHECLMAGSYTNSATNPDTFAELWNGSGWSLQPTPGEDGDTGSGLSAISCPSEHVCLAAGSITPGIGEPMSAVTDTLIERWTGSRWIKPGGQPENPAESIGNSPDNELAGLSCSSSKTCTAVGYADNAGPSCRYCGTLAARLGAHGWKLERPSQATSLVSVACPTATRCIAVGSQGAAEWNGKTWTLERSAKPRRGTLTAVSCSTRKLCIAVGTRHGAVFAERWNGRTWSAQAIRTPSGAKAVAVSGVSCPSARSCVLVGSDKTAGREVSLIETYS
jgi:hypothetical protein